MEYVKSSFNNCCKTTKSHDNSIGKDGGKFQLKGLIKDHEFVINGLVFALDIKLLGSITNLIGTDKFIAYDKIMKHFVSTKPADGDIANHKNTYKVVWFGESNIYKCRYSRISEISPSVVIYPKASSIHFTHTWVVWIDDIPLLMQLDTNKHFQLDTDGSYLKLCNQSLIPKTS